MQLQVPLILTMIILVSCAMAQSVDTENSNGHHNLRDKVGHKRHHPKYRPHKIQHDKGDGNSKAVINYKDHDTHVHVNGKGSNVNIKKPDLIADIKMKSAAPARVALKTRSDGVKITTKTRKVSADIRAKSSANLKDPATNAKVNEKNPKLKTKRSNGNKMNIKNNKVSGNVKTKSAGNNSGQKTNIKASENGVNANLKGSKVKENIKKRSVVLNDDSNANLNAENDAADVNMRSSNLNTRLNDESAVNYDDPSENLNADDADIANVNMRSSNLNSRMNVISAKGKATVNNNVPKGKGKRTSEDALDFKSNGRLNSRPERDFSDLAANDQSDAQLNDKPDDLNTRLHIINAEGKATINYNAKNGKSKRTSEDALDFKLNSRLNSRSIIKNQDKSSKNKGKTNRVDLNKPGNIKKRSASNYEDPDEQTSANTADLKSRSTIHYQDPHTNMLMDPTKINVEGEKEPMAKRNGALAFLEEESRLRKKHRPQPVNAEDSLQMQVPSYDKARKLAKKPENGLKVRMGADNGELHDNLDEHAEENPGEYMDNGREDGVGDGNENANNGVEGESADPIASMMKQFQNYMPF